MNRWWRWWWYLIGLLPMFLLGAVVWLSPSAPSDMPSVAPTVSTRPSGEPFLPGYLKMLRGVQEPDDGACHPEDLHELLLPCGSDLPPREGP